MLYYLRCVSNNAFIRSRKDGIMKYENEICPYCGNEFAEGDDIVVCPDCGTPHHRACWFAHGHCAVEDRHAEGYVWQSSRPAAEPEENTGAGRQTETEIPQEGMICPQCGTIAASGTQECPECSTPMVPFTRSAVFPGAGAFDDKENIGGVTAGELAIAVRTSAERYLNAFRKLAGGKAVTFSWAAFFFSPFWFFYRKLWKPAIIFGSIILAINVWMLPITDKYVREANAVIAEVESQAQEGESLQVTEAQQNKLLQIARPLIAPFSLLFIVHLIAGILGTRLYYTRCINLIEKAREEESEPPGQRLYLFSHGGVSFFGGFGSYIVLDIIVRMITTYFLE